MIQDPWAESHKLPAGARYYARKGTKQETETPVPAIRTHSPQETYTQVLAHAGCFPRDVVSRRIVEEVNSGTGCWGRREPEDLLEGLTLGTPPRDWDNDGIPDDWEDGHGLDKRTNDLARLMPSGYTAIEEYLHEQTVELLTPSRKQK